MRGSSEGVAPGRGNQPVHVAVIPVKEAGDRPSSGYIRRPPVLAACDPAQKPAMLPLLPPPARLLDRPSCPPQAAAPSSALPSPRLFPIYPCSVPFPLLNLHIIHTSIKAQLMCHLLPEAFPDYTFQLPICVA